MSNLKAQLTAALAGTSSNTPISTETLAKGHFRCRVEDALVEMYQAREVMWCEVSKRGEKTVKVWWLVGKVPPTPTQMLKSAHRKLRAAVEVEI